MFDFQRCVESLILDGINTISVEYPIFDIQPNNNIVSVNHANSFQSNLIRNKFTDHKKCIIICCKDNCSVVDYSLNILHKYGVFNNYDILLVDDRSQSNCIVDLSDKYNISCLKINNKNNIFNYSVINNIAVCYLKKLNKELIIFYNNDLWPSHQDTIDNLVKKHIDYGSDITGCKLCYPSKQEYSELGNPNHVLNNYLDHAYSTIQHGGIDFRYRRSSINNQLGVLAPYHTWRFYDTSNIISSIDTRCFAVTGAMQIINLSTFIEIGGFSSNFVCSFQDIDLCLKAIQKNLSVYYIGSEYLLHAESLTIAQENATYNRHLLQDNILWDVFWGPKLSNLLGMQAEHA